MRDALAEPTLIAHLVDLDAVTRDLVGVGRADALARGAELLPATLALVEAVDRDMPRHQEMRPVRDTEVVGADAAALEVRELLAQDLEIHDGARSDDAECVRIEDARGHEMELERAVLVDDGVTGVVAALKADDHVRLLRQEVRDLALALVTPLGPDDGGHWHVLRRYARRRQRVWLRYTAPSFTSSSSVRERMGSCLHHSTAFHSGSRAG